MNETLKDWKQRAEAAEAKLAECQGDLESHKWAGDRVVAAEAREAKLREALEAIRDHKPDEITDKIDHDVENCPDCKRMEGHPISRGLCNEWYHQHYRIEGKRKDARHSEQYQMRSIARRALTETEDTSNG